VTRFRLARRLPALIQTASGSSAVLLGFLVIVGWQTGSATLTQVRPGLAAMQYVDALAFVIAGVGALSAASRREGTAGIAGLLTAAIGLLSLTQDLLSVDPHVDVLFGGTVYLTAGAATPARMPPNAALCFAFVGAALFARRAGGAARMSLATSLLGTTTAAIGLIAIVGYGSDLAPAYGWGRLTQMALHTALGFVLVGSGLVAQGWRDSPTASATRRLPALVAVASLTATIVVWYALMVHDRSRTFQLIHTQALYLGSMIAEPIEAQAQVLERLGRRWSMAPAVSSEWTVEAKEYLEDFPACQAIQLVAAESDERWAVPEPRRMPGATVQVRDDAVRTALGRSSTIVTGPVDLGAGTRGFLVVVPIFRSGTPYGGIVGAISYDKLTERALGRQEQIGYEMALYDGVRLVHSHASAGEVGEEWTAQVDLGIRGTPLRLRLWPTPDRLAQLEGRMPSLILGGGLLLSAMLTSMTFIGGVSRRRERQLHEAAQLLRTHIKDREAAEGALRVSEERYRSLIDTASDIIYRVDPEGRFTFVNPVATRVMSRTGEELVGLHFLELVDTAARPAVARFYADQVEQRIAHTYFEFPAIAGNGSTIWIGQNVRLLLDGSSVTGLQAVARDITERKRVDADLAKARDAALESDRLKSEFVANVSHELRTPMNGILGLTELLLETELTPEQRDHAATVRECGETLLVLLNDILDLSKVAAGKLEIQAVAFEPRRLVQQTADLFAERARRKGVDLVCLVRHDVPDTVLGDPGRVRQVLTNLLGNAVKFTERGEITVRVTTEQPADAGSLLRIEVMDTGIGVSPDAQAQLFQPFVQADGSITRKYGGTGLGLVISRQLAGLMGGDMGMRSEPGAGSSFWFTIRVTPVAAQVRRDSSPAGLHGLRVLALDDSGSSRQRLRELLEGWEMHVTDAGSSDEALCALKGAAAGAQPFDVVLVNLRSPHTGVLAFAEAAHGAGIVPLPRMILISGRGQPGDAYRASELGASAYLTQPISQSDLFDCLATVMDAASAEVSPDAEPAPLITRYTIEKRQDRMKEPLLVVEDNPVNQKVMVGFLRKLGYRADVANDGLEALHALQRTSYRVVLMDSQMPQMDGFATTAEIRRRERDARRTIVVAVTAHAMKGERERCLAAGMDDYISKPVSLDRLSAVLERWLPAVITPAPAAVAGSGGSGASDAWPRIDAQVVARLHELETDVPGLVADVVSTFLRETPDRIERITAAYDVGDFGALEAAAHGLKGSAGAVGAQRLARLCAEIERSGHERSLNDAAVSTAALKDEFSHVREVLQREHLPALGRR